MGTATVEFTSARLLVAGASVRQPAASWVRSRVRSGERASMATRIPKSSLIATHLQLHLAARVPQAAVPLSGSGWVWPSSGADTGANSTLQEMSHVKSPAPPRDIQPPRLVQPGGTVGRTDRAGRGPYRRGADARCRRRPDRPAPDRADPA